MHLLSGYVMYVLAILVALLLPIGLALALLTLVFQRTRKNASALLALALVAAAYLTGGMAGWQMRPSQWMEPFGKTFEMALDADTYGHEVESRAERILMYPWYMATLSGIGAAAVLGLAIRLCRPRGA